MVKYVTKNQIKALYRKKLKPRLRRLDKERQAVKTKLIFLISIILGIIFFLLYKVTGFSGSLDSVSSKEVEGSLGILKFSLFVGTALFIIIYKWITKGYKNKFKQSIIKEMFDLLLQDAEFKPGSHVNDADFDRCDLITAKYNRYNGEDYVKGKIARIGIEFSELHVRHVTGSGKNKKDVIRFKGLFFKCTFSNKIKSPLLIHSDTAERLFGKMVGRFLQKKVKSGYELVQLESPEFEKKFAVYTQDQVAARVMLNPLTMDRLTKFVKRYKEKIEISIIDNHLYFLVHTRKDHFEPKIFSDALKWKDVMEIYDLLSLMVELINQFNLDKRVRSNVS